MAMILAARHEDVAAAEPFGSEDFGVLDENGMVHAFSFGPLPAASCEREVGPQALR